MRHALGGVGGIGDQAAERAAQNGGDILLRGHEVDHGHLTVLPDQQVAAAVQRRLVLHGGLLRNALAQKLLVLRAVEAAEEDAVPAGQLCDVVEAVAGFDAVRQRLPLGGVSQAAHHRVHAALQKLRRQDVQQLGGAGSIGVHVTAHVHALVLGPLQHGQRLRDLFAPVVPPHGLQMADVQGDAQFPRHKEHLLHGLAHAAALLPHVDGQRDVLPRQGLQRADQLAGGVEALRGVAQTQRHAQRAVGQRPLQLPVQGAVVPVRQMLQLVPGHVCPEDAGAGQHAHVYRQGGQAGEIARQRVRHQLRRDGAGDGTQIVPYGVPVRPAEGRGAETAVAVDDGGQPLTQLRRAEAGAQQRRVRMAVDVDKAGGDGLAGRVPHLRGICAPQVAHGGDPPAGHGYVGGKGRTACAIRHRAAPDKNIKHGRCLFPVFPPPAAGR